MQLRHFVALAAIAVLPLTSCADAASPKSEKERLSYSIGMDIAKNIKPQLEGDAKVDLKWVGIGLADAFGSGKTALTAEEAQAIVKAFLEAKQAERAAQQGQAPGADPAQAAENKAKGEAFLAANAKKSGIKTTASGLQYKVLTEGKGPKPKSSDKVKVHYTGTLTDGTKFDSSVDRGQPATFPVTGVIQGWVEGLQLMNTGSKYTFYIPSELAYGGRQQGAIIGPNSVLVFDVELLEIVK